MDSKTVINIYKMFSDAQIRIWIDGGWGVDALLEKQTRKHSDLDIVIQEKDFSKIIRLLEREGYIEIIRDDSSSWNFVFGNPQGQLVDMHVINFDEKGNGLYGPLERGVFYPADALKGKGIIGSIEVHCLTPEYQVISHTGYELKEKDYADVKNLCSKFKIKAPQEYSLS